MKKAFGLCLLIMMGLALTAGDAKWETDFEKAKQMAAKQERPILINFTGSDWCGWCKRLDREVFRKDAFSEFVDDNLVLLKIDFPKYNPLPAEQQERNYTLAEKYQVPGFPTILLVDANGKVLLRTSYQPGGVEKYIAHLKPHIK